MYNKHGSCRTRAKNANRNSCEIAGEHRGFSGQDSMNEHHAWQVVALE
jgi:hypothetical protein